MRRKFIMGSVILSTSSGLGVALIAATISAVIGSDRMQDTVWFFIAMVLGIFFTLIMAKTIVIVFNESYINTKINIDDKAKILLRLLLISAFVFVVVAISFMVLRLILDAGEFVPAMRIAGLLAIFATVFVGRNFVHNFE